MIGSYRKYFKESREAVLQMSWENFVLDLASIPVYEGKEEEKEEKVETVNALDLF